MFVNIFDLSFIAAIKHRCVTHLYVQIFLQQVET